MRTRPDHFTHYCLPGAHLAYFQYILDDPKILMDGWMDRWMDRRMDGWMDESFMAFQRQNLLHSDWREQGK